MSSSASGTAQAGYKRERTEEDENERDLLIPPPSSTTRNSGGITTTTTTRHQAARASSPSSPSSPTTTSTRLVIRDILVNNFKSYAGVHTIGPFHKTFTATIGPNGSGKSNVIDAMLFVFGKNAKKIRLEKLSELIHSSAAFPNLNHASVQVNFVLVRESEEDKKDPNQRLEVPGSEFSVSREVYKTNHSQYFVNGKKSTQRDVVELLTGHGIDLDHNRFLILQGEVEQIALMKPKAEKEGEEGLVEYFDDLIGSNKYETTIKEAAKIAEENQSQRLDQLDSLKRVQGERDALSSAKDSAYGYIRKDTHLQRIITVMCQLSLRIVEADLEEPRGRVNAINREIEGILQQLRTHEQEQQALTAKCCSEKEGLGLAKDEHAAIMGDKQKAEADLESIKTGVDENTKQQKKLQDRLKKCSQELRDLGALIHTATTDLTIATGNLEDAQSELSRLTPLYEKRTDDLHHEMKPLRQKLGLLKQQIAPFEQAVSVSKQKLEDAQYRVDSVANDQTKRLEDLTRLQEERDTNAKTIVGLTETIQNSESSGREVDAKINDLTQKVAALTSSKYGINSQIENIKREHVAQQSGDKAMMMLSEKGMPKYYGTLRQLGRIADEYDIAAGVASNYWSKHVVQDQETARQVIHLLKGSDMRGSVIVLDDVIRNNQAAMERDFKAPNGSQRLFDLIKPSVPKFAIAHYAAVKDTLVCADMTAARKIAHGGGGGGRHRVVTTAGGIVELSGVLTGGGGRPQGANLKASHTPADRDTTRQKLQTLQTELTDVVARESALQQEINEISQNRVSYNPMDIRTMTMKLSGLKANVDNSARRIRDAENRVKESAALAKELPSLQKAADAVEAEYQAAEKELRKNSVALKEVEKALDMVGGQEYIKMGEDIKRYQDTVATQQQRVSEAKKQRQKATITKESKEKDISKVEADVEKLKHDADLSTKSEIEAQSDVVNQLCHKSGISLKNVKIAESKVRQLEEEFAETKLVMSRLDSQKEDLDRSRREEESQMGEKLAKLETIKLKMEKCRQQIVKYAVQFGATALASPEASSIGGDIFGRNSQQTPSQCAGVKREREDGSDDEASDDEESPGNTGGGVGVNDDGMLLDEDDFDEANFSLEVDPSELDSYNLVRCSAIARELQIECKRLEGTIDLTAVSFWRQKQTEYLAAKARYDDIVARVASAEMKLEEVTIRRRELFMASFKIIQRKLKEMYQLLAHGGDADVDLVDSSDPYEGVNFTVRPPKKSWKQVSNLSGGEKTLSSLALVFALHHIRPTPIYVMDEIDAALDFRNVSIVAMYVLEQAQGAQFLIISLRNNMFELAHQLVGINKVNDVTRSLTLNPGMLAKLIAKRIQETKDAKAAAKQLSQQQRQQLTQ